MTWKQRVIRSGNLDCARYAGHGDCAGITAVDGKEHKDRGVSDTDLEWSVGGSGLEQDGGR